MALENHKQDAFSRILLHALRHAPDQYFLELDPGGWANLDNVALAMRYARAGWSDLAADDLRELVDLSLSERIEIAGDLIRARYGHSVLRVGTAAPSEPPPVLYHGTHAEALSGVRDRGLRPMGRQRVHLTSDICYAREVADAKGDRPVLDGLLTRGWNRVLPCDGARLACGRGAVTIHSDWAGTLQC